MGNALFGIDPIYLFIIGGTTLLSFLVSATLKRRFEEYSGEPRNEPMPVSGREVAEMMLRDNLINDVKVFCDRE